MSFQSVGERGHELLGTRTGKATPWKFNGQYEWRVTGCFVWGKGAACERVDVSEMCCRLFQAARNFWRSRCLVLFQMKERIWGSLLFLKEATYSNKTSQSVPVHHVPVFHPSCTQICNFVHASYSDVMHNLSSRSINCFQQCMAY